MAVEAPPGRMEQARAGMRRAALKRQVEAVAAGSGDRLPIDLEDGAFDVATVVAEVAWPLQPQSASLTRLVVALHCSRSWIPAPDVIARSAAAPSVGCEPARPSRR